MTVNTAELTQQNPNPVIDFVRNNGNELFGFTFDVAVGINFVVGAVDALRGGNDFKKRAEGVGAMVLSVAVGSLYGGSRRY